MPTDNRSSNTEMVSVPRALAERISNICMFTMCKEDWRALSEILAQPAQHQDEPVGEVVAFGKGLHEIAWAAGRMPRLGAKLYTHPAPADPGEVERLRAENEAFDAGMRNLACQLSAGGYNANSLTAAQLLEKVQWGLTHLTETHARLVDSLRAQLADQEKLHGGELGLPKEGWPEYHKRKMETLRNLTAGHYERKLAERDALLRELADAPPAAMEFRLQQKVKAALSASAEPQVKS